MSSKGLYIDEDERVLLSMRGFRVKKSPTKKTCFHLCSPTGAMVLIGLAIGFIMGYDQASNHLMSERQKVQTVIIGGSQYDASTTPSELIGLLRKQRKPVLKKLHGGYGDFASILLDDATLEKVFNLSSDSQLRFQRRVIRKLLQKQLSPEKRATFTWVTAGDHSASGKGNLPTDSYTEVLFDTVRDSFAAVGLDFVVKNRAIDGYGSGPALGLCMESVYGEDIDILSWDFGTTDGDRYYRSALWGTRAALHPSQPLLMMIDSAAEERWKQMFRIDGRVGVALMDTNAVLDVVRRQFPDSAAVPVETVKNWPPAVKHLKCNGSLEGHYFCKDSPKKNFICNHPDANLCRENKFLHNGTCKMTKYQTDWMPGWKDHRLKGRLMGIFLLKMLQDALLELGESMHKLGHAPVDKQLQKMLQKCQQQDDQDKFLITNSPLPDNILGRYSERIGSKLVFQLLHRPANCLLASVINDRNQILKQHTSRHVRRRLKAMETNITETVNISDAVLEPTIKGGTGSTETQHVVAGPATEVLTGRDIEVPTDIAMEESSKATQSQDERTSPEASTAPSQLQSSESVSMSGESASIVEQTAPTSVETTGSLVNAGANEQVEVEAVMSGATVITESQEETQDAVVMSTESEKDSNIAHVQTTSTPQTEAVLLDLRTQTNGTIISAVNQIDSKVIVPTTPAPAQNDTNLPEVIVTQNVDTSIQGETPAIENGETVNLAKTTESMVQANEITIDDADDTVTEEIAAMAHPSMTHNDTSTFGEDVMQTIDASKQREEVTANNEAPAPPKDVLGPDTVQKVSFLASESSQNDLEVEEVPLPDNGSELSPFMPWTSNDESLDNEESEMCEKIHPQHKYVFQVVTKEKEYDMMISGNSDSYLMTCFQLCTFGECRKNPDDFGNVKLSDGSIAVEVDGESVVSTREVDGCHLLEGTSGALWKTKRDYFQIRFRIREEGGALLLFSVLTL